MCSNRFSSSIAFIIMWFEDLFAKWSECGTISSNHNSVVFFLEWIQSIIAIKNENASLSFINFIYLFFALFISWFRYFIHRPHQHNAKFSVYHIFYNSVEISHHTTHPRFFSRLFKTETQELFVIGLSNQIHKPPIHTAHRCISHMRFHVWINSQP